MQPENDPFEKETHLPNLHFGVQSVSFFGGETSNLSIDDWKVREFFGKLSNEKRAHGSVGYF